MFAGSVFGFALFFSFGLSRFKDLEAFLAVFEIAFPAFFDSLPISFPACFISCLKVCAWQKHVSRQKERRKIIFFIDLVKV